jgi:23S rRNA (adenine2030-N6)-methyltransferase
MNYRHAYHAGNFADCFKHALLVSILDSLAIKRAPYFVLDTHAGAGRYNLDDEPARRTAEADLGIRRLLQNPVPSLERYLRLVAELGLYPGSPSLIRSVMRDHDRMACCELHPEDAATLRRQFANDEQVAVHHRSGWEALSALLPPREKRGLVFVDSPFEAPDEFLRLTEGLCRGYGRFSHGLFAAWYPIKQMAAARNFHSAMTSSGIRDIVAVDIHIRDAAVPGRLNGCGLIVINPPYQFEDQAGAIASAVLQGISDNLPSAGMLVRRLADE